MFVWAAMWKNTNWWVYYQLKDYSISIISRITFYILEIHVPIIWGSLSANRLKRTDKEVKYLQYLDR